MSDIKNKISEIKNIALEKFSIEELKLILKQLLQSYSFSALLIDEGLDLYRGIKYDKPPNLLVDLSYPPPNKAKINRASRDGQPMFYCATSREIPFYELDLKPKDRLVISKWKTEKKILVNHCGYSNKVFEKYHSNRINPILNDGHEQNLTKDNLELHDSIAEMFSQKIPDSSSEIYKITIAIAECLYENEHKARDKKFSNLPFAGLAYPSFKMNANSDNLVIKPQFVVNEYIVFNEAEFVEIESVYADSKYDFEFDINIIAEANSILRNGEIDWKDSIPHLPFSQNFEELTYDFENGILVARDDFGNIIYPTNQTFPH